MNGERGAATLPVLAVAIVTVVLGALIGDVAAFIAARSRATVAADAAALAAAPLTFAPFGAGEAPATEAPTAEAALFAAANGAALQSCECAVDRTWAPRTVRVVVAVPADLLLFGQRLVAASSRADFTPTQLPP